MALVIGDQAATSGMTQAIFQQLDTLLMSAADKAKLSAADLEKVRDGWRKLAFAIATGVVSHLKANMEITGVQATSGAVSLDVVDAGGNPVGQRANGTINTTQTGPVLGHVN
jgi:hypothetical protein